MKRSRHSAPPTRRAKIDVSPVRMALLAARRIHEVAFHLDHTAGVRLGKGLAPQELAAREGALRRQLPPSYVAVVRHVSELGGPEELLDAATMQLELNELRKHAAASRYLPFARAHGKLLCFDLRGDSVKNAGELPVVAWHKGYGAAVARGFAEWLDALADHREERLATAANVPPRLERLLRELGFGSPKGLVVEVETADSDAVEALVGEDTVDALLADGTLYDSTGKALVQLQLDDFSLRVRLRTGFFDVVAEDVFSWLRSFRDEDFFAPLAAEPAAARRAEASPAARDLRRAERRAVPRIDGVVSLLALPAQNHAWLDAAGLTADDVTLLGRVNGSMRSVLVRVEGTRVTSARSLEEPLSRLHTTPDGTLWALGGTFAYRFRGFEQERFALLRPTDGPTNWLGIGGHGEHVLVWGAGALLAFDGSTFVPFAPDLALDPVETVVAVEPREEALSALVVREGFGAIAHCDHDGWSAISEEALVQGAPIDLRSFAGQEWVLDQQGVIYTQSGTLAPRPVPFPRSAPAFTDEHGRARPLYDLLPARTGLLMASRGGFLLAPTSGEATFFRGQATQARARLVHLGAASHTLALLEGATWVHAEGAFHPLDLTQF